ncbi:MAG: ParB/Srx family N-terminal domain-containing protein, partial [Pseudomonadota bacterium]
MTNAREQTARSAGNAARPLQAVNRPIEELRLAAKNPRRHDRRQVRQIARSIESFGFNVPVLIDAECNVVAGHGRVLAARELGLSEVPTIRLDHLSA